MTIPNSLFTIVQADTSAPPNPLVWRNGSLHALYKPSGMLVHNSAYAGPREHTLLDAVEQHTGQRVFPLHRIDRGTSGLILAVTSSAETTSWMPALHHPDTIREYIVLVRGALTTKVRIERPIPNERGEDQEAVTLLAPLKQSKNARVTLARARILTGRKHQIRRHCRSLGYPVVGDATWGNSAFNREMKAHHQIDRLALHAWRVQMTGPDGCEYDVVSLPDPHFQEICVRLFDFDKWRSFASMATMDLEVDHVHRDKGGKGLAV